MAIMVAVQKGASVYVYDQKNHCVFTKTGQLAGYTANSVTIKQSKTLTTFDEKGHVVRTDRAY